MVEGDIKGFFDNVDHHVLIRILEKTLKIKDSLTYYENYLELDI